MAYVETAVAPVDACYLVKCDKCDKTTWKGCGQHADAPARTSRDSRRRWWAEVSGLKGVSAAVFWLPATLRGRGGLAYYRAVDRVWHDARQLCAISSGARARSSVPLLVAAASASGLGAASGGMRIVQWGAFVLGDAQMRGHLERSWARGVAGCFEVRSGVEDAAAASRRAKARVGNVMQTVKEEDKCTCAR
ncbi:hypothetical protein C8Q79DRAFT_489980 [Trametes meyenii]|nr:hypothetical protein C8Q79DRAFT_489980 [Trametes meyenii]